MDEELERGNEAVKALCLHVKAMNADKFSNTLVGEDGSVYTVTVVRARVQGRPSSSEV